MHHNDVEFWRHLQSLPAGHKDLPSPRVCRLLLKVLEGWKSRPGWLDEADIGHLFRDRVDLTPTQVNALASKPVAVRKALATKRMLELIVDPRIARRSASCSISPDELIVGTLPPFSVGQGKEFVRYLTQEEELAGALDYLNELSPMGHIVPNHALVLERGLQALVAEARTRGTASAATPSQRAFYESVAVSLEAVMGYALRYAEMARAMAATLPASDERSRSLLTVAENLEHAPANPPRSFHEALQAIYIVHCALHWTVEIVPIGRLDQLLIPFYEKDIEAKRVTPDGAQELIDCFWLKLDERVILSYRHAENRFTSSDGVLTGYWGASNFDQGGLLNQWMQQVTIGGVLSNDDAEPKDACNDVTSLCLEAARRLPLNSPTLDLRVHTKTPDRILEHAARALLSGGAHPVLLNDEVIVPALQNNSGPTIPLAAARNYACDGCYETMVAGESEFSFGFIFALETIEKTLNRGAGLADAGPINLRGRKDSWRSKPAADIGSFDEFRTILIEHLLLSCHRYLRGLTLHYGNKEAVAPSPLLSALISGCMESGTDLTAGGARYHIFSPLLIGVSNAADSLYVIERLVFDDKAFSLQELTTCLATDWGHSFIDACGESTTPFGPHVSRKRIDEIRELCLAQPKFGNGVRDVDTHAWWLLEAFTNCVAKARMDPVHVRGFEALSNRYGDASRPFAINLAPGVGTFEQYVSMGFLSGASADGRRSRDPIASDLSPSPIASDRPATVCGPANAPAQHARQFRLDASLKSYSSPVMQRLGDGAPVDYNIGEDMDVPTLTQALRSFSKSGASICTFTVADPATFLAAQKDPERYNLVRVRMGGWTEFFVALFPAHQEQHRRRPFHV